MPLSLFYNSSLSPSDSAAVARRHGGGDSDDEEKNDDNDDDETDDDDENDYIEPDGRFELPRLTGWRLDQAGEERNQGTPFGVSVGHVIIL